MTNVARGLEYPKTYVTNPKIRNGAQIATKETWGLKMWSIQKDNNSDPLWSSHHTCRLQMRFPTISFLVWDLDDMSVPYDYTSAIFGDCRHEIEMSFENKSGTDLWWSSSLRQKPFLAGCLHFLCPPSVAILIWYLLDMSNVQEICNNWINLNLGLNFWLTSDTWL